MRLKLHDDVLYRRQFALVEERFDLMFGDAAGFRALTRDGLLFMNAAHVDEKIALLASGFFSKELLQAMICGGSSYATGPIDYIWRRLVDRQIMILATGHMPGIFVDHTIVTPLLQEHLRARTLLNVFIPPAAFVTRYRDAIVAVDVRTAAGDLSRGSGFFAVAAEGAPAKLYTCRHNVDPNDGIEIVGLVTASGRTLRHGAALLHPSEDIAVIPVADADQPATPFRMRHEVEMFDEVYTVGYPMVPFAEAGLVGHRGEVNGTARLISGGSNVLIISNLISPGNSGGAVLDRDGFCVGMSVKWLEAEWSGEKARFSAALPADLLTTI